MATRKKAGGPTREPRIIIAAAELQSYLAAVRAVTPTCRVQITPEGLQAVAVDQGNVAMVEARLLKGAFKEYGLEEGEIGLDLEKLQVPLALMEGEDVTATATEGRLEIRGGPARFQCQLVDLKGLPKRPTVPAMDLPVAFRVDPAKLKKVLASAEKMADKARIVVMLGRVCVVAESLENDVLETALECTEDPTEKQKAASIYSLDYLRDFMAGLKPATEIRVNLATDKPLRLIGTTQHMSITYWMAPCIEDEEVAPSAKDKEDEREDDDLATATGGT